jgi:hypothetical protein
MDQPSSTRIARGIVAFAITLAAGTARAEPIGTWLEVERAPGSENCADADAVFRAMDSLFPEREMGRSVDPAHVVASAQVKVRPTSFGHEALVRVTLPRPGERVILVKEVDCRGLADALAVTLVMLLEPPQAPRSKRIDIFGPATIASATANAPSVPEPAKTTSRPKESPRPSPKPAPAQPDATTAGPMPALARRARFDTEMSATGMLGIGLLPQLAGGPAIGFAMFHTSGVGFMAEGTRLWSLPSERGGGKVTVRLWGLFVGPCFRQRLSRRAQLDVCLRLGAGLQQAASTGYRAPGNVERPWLVVGPNLVYNRVLSPSLHAYLGLGVVGQLRRETFSVDGVGLVADAPRAGLTADLGLKFGGRLF